MTITQSVRHAIIQPAPAQFAIEPWLELLADADLQVARDDTAGEATLVVVAVA